MPSRNARPVDSRQHSDEEQVDLGAEPISGGRRSARKRQAIMDAATTLFLRDGYRSTSMDQVAADAVVSKPTVYSHFEDKEQLFREIVLGVTANSEKIITELTSTLYASDINTVADLRVVLIDLARRYIDGVLRPNVLSLRRLVISEAERFPDLAPPTTSKHPPVPSTSLPMPSAVSRCGGCSTWVMPGWPPRSLPTWCLAFLKTGPSSAPPSAPLPLSSTGLPPKRYESSSPHTRDLERIGHSWSVTTGDCPNRAEPRRGHSCKHPAFVPTHGGPDIASLASRSRLRKRHRWSTFDT